PPAAPPPNVYAVPPTVYVIPPPSACGCEEACAAPLAVPTPYVAPAPPRQQLGMTDVDDLYRRGRGKKIAGGLLIGLGVLSLVTGAAVAIAGAMPHFTEYGGYGFGAGYSHHNQGMVVGGGSVAFLGGLSMLAGIPTIIVGNYQVGKARRLRPA